jgi:hypothetical protein
MKKRISILSIMGVLLAVTTALASDILVGSLGYASQQDVIDAGGTQQEACRPIELCQGEGEACQATFNDDNHQQVTVILRQAGCVNELERN